MCVVVVVASGDKTDVAWVFASPTKQIVRQSSIHSNWHYWQKGLIFASQETKAQSVNVFCLKDRCLS